MIYTQRIFAEHGNTNSIHKKKKYGSLCTQKIIKKKSTNRVNKKTYTESVHMKTSFNRVSKKKSTDNVHQTKKNEGKIKILQFARECWNTVHGISNKSIYNITDKRIVLV